MAQRFQKSATSERVFTIDLTDMLAALPDVVTISSVTWTVPVGLTKQAQSNTTMVARAKISGGTLGTEYVVTATITLSNGEVDVRTIYVTIVRL